MPEREYLTRKEASFYISQNYFPCATATLAKFVTNGGGPLYRKIGSTRVCYIRSELDKWANERISKALSNSSEYKYQ